MLKNYKEAHLAALKSLQFSETQFFEIIKSEQIELNKEFS
jgi:hypothetical protein